MECIYASIMACSLCSSLLAHMSCVRNPFFEFLASMWQGVVSSVGVQGKSVEVDEERKLMRMSMIQHDLDHCHTVWPSMHVTLADYCNVQPVV